MILSRMVRWAFLLFFCMNGRPPFIPEAQELPISQPSFWESRSEAIDSSFSKVYEIHRLVGLQAAVYSDNRLVYSGRFGFADLEAEMPVTSSAKFPTASIGKAFTATALLKLVDDERVNLDNPIQDYFPGFPVKPEGAITPRLLATHQSGIRHYREGERTPDFYAHHFDDIASAMRLFADDPLVSSPGSRYSYTSYGYNLLAVVIQSASGMPFQKFIEEQIFKPLDLEHTSFNDVRHVIKQRAKLYSYSDPGRLRAPKEDRIYRVPSTWDYSYNAGGGNLLSCAVDLARFGKSFFGPGLLTENSLALARNPQSTPLGEQTAVSFGWFAGQTHLGQTMRINGAFLGSYADLRIFPDAKLSIAFMTNTSTVGNLHYVTGAIAEYLLGNAADPALVMEADLWFANRRWERAAEKYTALIKMNLKDGRSWLRRGTSLINGDRIDEAVSDLKEAAKFEPFRPEAYRQLCVGYAVQEELDRALDMLQEALRAGFDDWAGIAQDRRLKDMRSDPRYRALAQKYGSLKKLPH